MTFPVLAAAQKRQGRKITSNAIARGRRVRIDDTVQNSHRTDHSDARPSPSNRAVSGAKPFIKWAGGKRQLLGPILSSLPKEFGTFHEPFIGGGAVFFGLRPRAAVLYDQNERLIRAYCGVKNSVETVINILKTYRNDKGFFLKMRQEPVDDGSDAEVAAWLIFLNKTGFNGIYRVNSKNHFNVPYANNQRARICDEDNLRACAAALVSAELRCADFAAVLETARPGDAVYFDPPYIPISVTSYFTSYTTQGFGLKEQVRLRDVALELRKRGVSVLLSNSSAPAVTELYGPFFECVPVSAFRLVNSDPKGRGRITELLIK